MLHLNGFYHVGTSFNIKIVLDCGMPHYVCSTISVPKSVKSPLRHDHVHLHIVLLIAPRSVPEVFSLLMRNPLSQIPSQPNKGPYHSENHARGGEYSDYVSS